MSWLRLASTSLLMASLPAMAWAVVLSLPSTARQTGAREAALDAYILPLGAFANGAVPGEVMEGRVQRQTWRIDGGSYTTLQTLAPLRTQLTEAGFDILFECNAPECGGFDFRFGIEVVPAPDMHVDIQDFRFLSARRGAKTAASLLISRSRGATFVQFVLVSPTDAPVTETVVAPEPGSQTETQPLSPRPAGRLSLAEALNTQGHVVLDDLAFAPGGSTLEEREYDSLRALAAFLAEVPDGTLVLVGHTDTVGDLATNIRLSKRRAESVRTRLIGNYDLDPDRIQAEGNGYLSPIASNLTKAGREANRRVEAILKP